jgi:hypothetical protein
LNMKHCGKMPLIADFDYKFSCSFPACQIDLCLSYPLRGEGVFLEDLCLQSAIGKKGEQRVSIVKHFCWGICVVVHAVISEHEHTTDVGTVVRRT